MIATNYIGAFVLTKLLLPLLESSRVSSRIVNVTSFTHRNGTDNHHNPYFLVYFCLVIQLYEFDSPELDYSLHCL